MVGRAWTGGWVAGVGDYVALLPWDLKEKAGRYYGREPWMFVGGKLDAATQTYMGGELEAATKVLADAIVEGEKAVGKENAGILWLRNLLAEAEQNSVKKWVCCHANFSLRAALVNNSSLYTRLTLIENTKMVQEELYRKAPDDEQAARDLSISYSNLGKIQLQLGNPPEALAYFKKYNAMCEELYRKAPDDARAARDPSVSYDNLGNIQLQLEIHQRRSHTIRSTMLCGRAVPKSPRLRAGGTRYCCLLLQSRLLLRPAEKEPGGQPILGALQGCDSLHETAQDVCRPAD